MNSPTWRPHAATFAIGAALAGAWLIGCATGEDDVGLADENLPTQPAASSSSQIPETRPPFDAGFEDATQRQPTEDSGGSGGGGDAGCVDPGDPGSTQNTAKTLSATDDSQNSPISVRGVFNGSIDVDYYKLPFSDVAFASTIPDIQSKTNGVELCVFVKCPNETTVSCAGPTTKNEQGLDGCCGTGISSEASPSWRCPAILSANDSATLYFRAKPTGGAADQCVPYSFSYAF